MTEQAAQRIAECRRTRGTFLNLSDCELSQIPAVLNELVWLEILYLTDNQITKIEGLDQLQQLTALYLYNNQITKIEGLDQLQQLTELVLHSNQITKIEGLDQLQQLIILDLDDNQITKIEGLDQLQQLTALYLSANQITKIEGLDQLQKLTNLHLYNNQITKIEGLDQLQQLTALYLAINQITKIEGLDQLQQLTILYLTDNQITKIEGLDQLQQLTNLHLYNNQITKIEGLDQLQQLTELHLFNNQITKIEGLDQLQQLTELLLFSNQIIKIEGLDQLQQLTELYLYFNPIEDIQALRFLMEKGVPVKWSQSMGSKGIYLFNNPLKIPPPEIVQQGNKAILTYFNEPLRPINETKVIFVGEGAAGKTSLIKLLLGEPLDPHESQTHGIHIRREQLPIQDEKVTVHFWDFGGQEIMHATHQFFLSKRSVYVLVLDSRKDEKAEYWLKRIQSFGGDSPVLVVLNKIDQHPSFRVNEQFLQDKYPSIQEFFRVSCKTEEGGKPLREKLWQELWDLPMRQVHLPEKWHDAKRAFEHMKDNYITYQRFSNICKKYKVTKKYEQNILLDYLNDLGIVLHYEKLRLHDTQVLNPLWLTNGVYRIINSLIVDKQNGRFNLQQLNDIINDERFQPENPEAKRNLTSYKTKKDTYPEDKLLFIAQMMRQFELCFRVGEEDYIVPDLLKVEQNTLQFDGKDKVLRFVLEYPDFLPDTVFPRLMVRLHNHVYESRQWRTGMVLHEPLIFKAIANIVLDKEAQKFNIEIAGERNRDFLSTIRQALKEINDSFKIKINEWIPLPDKNSKGEIEYVDYEELIGYEKEKVAEYFSGKLRKKYSVADLLNGIESPEVRHLAVPMRAFISYSHKDKDYKDKFKIALSPLMRSNQVTLWDDGCIVAGDKWEDAIYQHLEDADLVLSLISSDFIASEFCHENELQKALAAHHKNEKVVIPIRIRECLWEGLEISTIQGLPGKWMTRLDDDSAWTEVAKGVEKAILQIKQRKFQESRKEFPGSD